MFDQRFPAIVTHTVFVYSALKRRNYFLKVLLEYRQVTDGLLDSPQKVFALILSGQN